MSTTEELNIDRIMSKPYPYIMNGVKLTRDGQTYTLLDINITKNELVLFNIDRNYLVTIDSKTGLIVSLHSFVARYYEATASDKLLSRLFLSRYYEATASDKLLPRISTNTPSEKEDLT